MNSKNGGSRATAFALKDARDLVKQKQKMDKAVDSLLNYAQDVPVIPHRGTARPWLEFNVAHRLGRIYERISYPDLF
jgi:hypothetical protein